MLDYLKIPWYNLRANTHILGFIIMGTAFIGHRTILTPNLRERLLLEVENLIELGCKNFTMGTHGEFDFLALSVCRQLKRKYRDLDIDLAITSLNSIKKDEYGNTPYESVNTFMYEIEDTYFKRQITLSNQLMLEHNNILVCYVDKTRRHSGAKSALDYAEKLGLKIINLYPEKDG